MCDIIIISITFFTSFGQLRNTIELVQLMILLSSSLKSIHLLAEVFIAVFSQCLLAAACRLVF